jgi:hypothetical protein
MNSEINKENMPIVIGGTGGSGTRVVQSILEKAGLFMGNNLNVSKDALDFVQFLNRDVPEVLKLKRTLSYRIEDLPEHMKIYLLSEFKRIIENFLIDKPQNMFDWGWKVPGIIYALPFVYYFYPDFRFIHIIRDGRDMAFSTNQVQVYKFYSGLYGVAPSHVYDSIRLWEKTNFEAALWAKKTLKDRYLLVRYEDLCSNPRVEIEKIFGFLNLNNTKEIEPILQNSIIPPPTIGRWKEKNKGLIAGLEGVAHKGLSYFNYLS